MTKENKKYYFRVPDKNDGAAIWELIKHTGTLDLNSSYSYLLWCEMFSDTSIVVESKGSPVGFISGFIHPKKSNTLFIWQVAVHKSEQGNGLGTKMLFELLGRENSVNIRYIEATISPTNIPSQNLFQGFANKLHTDCVVGNYFSSFDFPEEGHEDELLFQIGPIKKK